MTVIVLDTNALPRGHFSLSSLERLIEVAGESAVVIVPEVVIWEWAEHAYSTYIAVEEAAKAVRVDTNVLARPVINPAPSVEVLAQRIEDSLPAGVRLWSPAGEVWRGAIRDQILQVGSGEMKSNVKTGAADAVVLACVSAESAQADDVVLLVTSDKKLQKATQSFGNVRCATGDKGLLSAMYSFTPAADDLEVRLMEQLPEYLNARISDEGEAISFAEYGVGVHFGPGQAWPAGAVLSSIMFKRVDIAEIGDLEIQSGEQERRGFAELRLFGDFVATVVEHYNPTLGAAAVSRTEVEFSHEFVDVTVEVAWNQHWRIQKVRATGVALLVILDPSEDEADENTLTFFAAPEA